LRDGEAERGEKGGTVLDTQSMISVVCLVLMAVCVAVIIIRRKKKKVSKEEEF
jgi:preprotein translocase subunit YajC